jgi:type IV/VI secretion system ImpK/VasF family protein
MTSILEIVDLCEPLFVYVCFLNKCGREKKDISFITAQNKIDDLLTELHSNLTHGTNKWRQFSKIELPLLFFIDSIICESDVSFAEEWDKNRLAYSRGEMTGDKKFFDVLEELFNEYSVDADKCITFFYTCIGLGFTGIYKDNSEKIKYYLDRITTRIPGLDDENIPQIQKEVFSNVDHRNLQSKDWLTLTRIVVITIILVIAFISFNVFLFFEAVNPLFGLFAHVDSIVQVIK